MWIKLHSSLPSFTSAPPFSLHPYLKRPEVATLSAEALRDPPLGEWGAAPLSQGQTRWLLGEAGSLTLALPRVHSLAHAERPRRIAKSRRQETSAQDLGLFYNTPSCDPLEVCIKWENELDNLSTSSVPRIFNVSRITMVGGRESLPKFSH